MICGNLKTQKKSQIIFHHLLIVGRAPDRAAGRGDV